MSSEEQIIDSSINMTPAECDGMNCDDYLSQRNIVLLTYWCRWGDGSDSSSESYKTVSRGSVVASRNDLGAGKSGHGHTKALPQREAQDEEHENTQTTAISGV